MAAILIVEDRPIDRKFMATLLRTAGHTVIEASDGAEGLRLAEADPPDLVISDILMPTVDGYEFVQRMRDSPVLADTPVIFYSATYHEREARALAQQCGVADILMKPAAPDTILATVGAVLASGERPVSAWQDRSNFSRDHLQVVNAVLSSKIGDFEASEQRMAVIVGLAHQIAAEREPRALLDKVCAAAREITLAQHAIITMLTDDASAFRRVATSGLDEDTVARMDLAPVSGPTFKDVIGERRPVRMQNPDGRPEAVGLPGNHPSMYSCLVVPIASPTHVYGCLALRNKIGTDGFSDRDEEVAVTLATHAGIAYENARLYDDLRQRSAALELEVANRRHAEERTQLALAAARMGVWEAGLVSGQIAWSDTMAVIFGRTPEQAPKTVDEFYLLIHPEDRAAAREGFQRAVREGTDLIDEFRIIAPDGTLRWIAGRARIVRDTAANPKTMIGVGIDVSDRKSLEEQLRQAQKMEAIGQLAGGVAHDFNNLLTAIRGYADLVQVTLGENDRRRADVDEIVKAAERATGLTRQLLAFSRKQILQPTRLDLNRLIADTNKMLRRLIGEDIEVVTRLAPDLAPVHADPGQIEQIVMNLAVNARDAMPRGGQLSIETANVALDESCAMQHMTVRPGAYVMLSVADTGIGMDQQTKRRIFDERPVVERETSPVGSETVLLVEDEEAVRYLSRVILERAGYSVLDAGHPQRAEEVFRQHGELIDLLVTDVIMPGCSGPALFALLSTDFPRLRVLYMSGYTDDAFVHQAGLPPDVTFLQKPFTADGLLCKVREAIDR